MNCEQDIRIKIHSDLYEVEASLFSELEGTEEYELEDFEERDGEGNSDTIDINTFGKLKDNGKRFAVKYDETDTEGMGNSTTYLSFEHAEPQVVTMTRFGDVSTTLVFEEGKRYHCLYQTPIMPFEVCVYTKKVDNRLLTERTLCIDYIVEIRGAKAEHTRFSLKLL